MPTGEDCSNAADDDCDGLDDAQDDDCGRPGTSISGGTVGGTDSGSASATDSAGAGDPAGGGSGCACNGAPAAPPSWFTLGLWAAAAARRRRRR